ncbi:MAG: nitroreductase family protein, partial [Bacteroidales bacterium]|nr:nitroreductase family protein [Bacteroidales bacterium]
MTKITKKQEVIHPVLKEIEHRWSPRAFDLQMPEEKYLRSMFEAARRAPSAFNDQPWSFIIGRKGDETYTHILTSLIDFNVGWAKSAPILMVACGSSLSSNGQQENTTYAYDTGQSIAYFSLQAMQ